MAISWQQRLRRVIADPSHLALALIIGALVGSTIVAFLACTDWMNRLLFGAAMSVWMRPLTPAIAALIAGYLLLRFFPNARGSGIPQTKAALIAGGGHISLKNGDRQVLLLLAVAGGGIALGREGPSVQIGAGLRPSWPQAGLGEARRAGDRPDGRRGGAGGGVQHAHGRGAIHAGGMLGDLNAPRAGLGRDRRGDFMDGAAFVPGRRATVPRAALQSGASLGVPLLRSAGRGRRPGVGGVLDVTAVAAARGTGACPSGPSVFQPATGGLTAGVLALYSADVLGAGYAAVELALQRRAQREGDVHSADAETRRHRRLLQLRQRRRHLRPQPILRRDARRRVRLACCTLAPGVPPGRRALTRWSAWARPLRASSAAPSLRW